MKRFLIGLSLLANVLVLVGLGGLYAYTDGFAFLRKQRDRVRSLYEVVAVQPGDVVFLGDSITAGGPWNELFPGVPAKNRGIGGDTTTDLLDRLHPITRGRPAKVFLAIGTNDLMGQVSPEEIAANIATILDRIYAESPATTVYLQSVLPRDALLTPAVRELNERLETLAGEREIGWIDLFPAFVDESGSSIKNDYSNDELHLMGPGYTAWRDLLAPWVHDSTEKDVVTPAPRG